MSASDSFVSPDDAAPDSPRSRLKILHVVVLVGLLPGIYCISVPYPLLESGPVLLAAAVLYICAICVVIGAPAEGHGKARYALISLAVRHILYCQWRVRPFAGSAAFN